MATLNIYIFSVSKYHDKITHKALDMGELSMTSAGGNFFLSWRSSCLFMYKIIHEDKEKYLYNNTEIQSMRDSSFSIF